ncbi:MAG: hypothetical protein E6Z25_06370 [Negativicoccus succinicivorans]|uniref:hypothetical protein n=1 Tax=Negativicoccus succinicivorans TaxID=620903 RepID=UPI002906C008|nr:hypothetical protein [Negativicoccus succinicivorans]MDU5915677.1 hypothetical protein [Negativicoccus succinicivorans]
MTKMMVMRLADYGLPKGAEKHAENPAGKGGRAVDICYNKIIKITKTGNIPREWQHGFIFGNSFGRFGLFIGMSSFLL